MSDLITMYALLKIVHISCVALSFGLFFLRGVWMLRAPWLLAARWVRILPHIIDTILLSSAVALVIMSRQYPGVEPWLSAKVIALVLYILLGMVALRPAVGRRTRILAWLSALLMFTYIVGVALTRSVLW